MPSQPKPQPKLSLVDRISARVNAFEDKVGPSIGYVYGLFANFLFAFYDFKIRETNEVPTFQMLFYKSLLDVILSTLYIAIAKIPMHYKSTALNRMFFIGAFFEVGATCLIFYGLQRANLSEAIALYQLAPVLTAVFGVILLNEKFDFTQGLVTAISLIGMVLIVKPTFLFGDSGHGDDADSYMRAIGNISVLGAALCTSIFIVLARKMAVEEADPQIGILYFACLLAMTASMGMTMQGFRVLAKYEVQNIAVICFLSFLSNYFHMRAVRFGDAGKIILMSYAEIPFGYLLDVMFLGHIPEFISTSGVCLIFSCLFIQVFRNYLTGCWTTSEGSDKPKAKTVEVQHHSRKGSKSLIH